MAEIKDPTAAITDKRFQEPLAILRSGREKEAGKAQELARAEGAVETEKQRVAELESGLQTAAAEKEAGAVREARDIYQEKLGKEPLPEFVPTQDNVQSIASLFSLIGVMGMVAGKGDAMRAMHAMNGMLEGHQKGRADLYKQEKATFEKNFNAMVKKHEEFRKEMEDAVKTAATDRELGYQKAREAAVKAGSNVVKAMIEKFGVAKAYESLIADNKSVEKAYELYRQEKRHAEDMALKYQEKQQKATQQQFRAQSIINALGGVTSAVENISKLPAGATTGVLPNLTTKDGMFNAVRNFAGRTVSKTEAKSLDTLFKGVSRNLAAIEASGAATGLVGLAQSLESLAPRAGDNTFDAALKMADIRRIAAENVGPLITSGLLTREQAATAGTLVKRLEEAIPFTTEEVINARYGGKQTIGTAAQDIVEKGRLSEEKRKRLEELERKERGE